MKAEQLDKENATQPFIEAALALRQAGENSEALRVLNKALKLDNKDPGVLVLIGLIYQDMSELEKAERYYRRALKKNPEDPDTLKSLGLLLLSNERRAEGAALLIEYIQQGHWNDQAVLATLANKTKDIAQHTDVAALLKNAWEKSFDPKVGYLYARYLRFIERSDEAILVLVLISHHEDYHTYWNELGINYTREKQWDAAISAFQEAIDNAEEFKIGNISKTKNLGRKLKMLKTYNIFIGAICPMYIMKQIKEKKALEAANKALNFTHMDRYPWECKVNALMKLSRYEEAAETAQDAINHLPSDEPSEDITDLYVLLVHALEEIQREDEALKIIGGSVL